jgi:hypothetical protein
MAQAQIADVVVPAEFTVYQVENSRVSTALYPSRGSLVLDRRDRIAADVRQTGPHRKLRKPLHERAHVRPGFRR